jgi:hypothetical protein
MDVSATVKSALEDAVKTGPAKPATRAATLKAALDENRDLILKAIGQGYSATGLAKKLKASGLSASVESLRQALQVVVSTSTNGSKAKAPKTRSTSAATTRVITPRPARATKNKAFEAEDRTA